MNYNFEVHTFAPELNKVFLNGINVSKNFDPILKKLTKDYKSNIRLVRRCNYSIPHLPVWTIEVKHSIEDHKCCDRIYKYRSLGFSQLVEFLKYKRAYHNLPDVTINVSVKY